MRSAAGASSRGDRGEAQRRVGHDVPDDGCPTPPTRSLRGVSARSGRSGQSSSVGEPRRPRSGARSSGIEQVAAAQTRPELPARDARGAPRVPGRRRGAPPRRRRRQGRVARASGYRSRHHGEIPAPEGAPTVLLYSHYDVGAGRRRVEVGVAAVRGDRARRRDLRPGHRRHEVEHPHARRRAARLGGQAAGGDQGRDRGHGGGRQRVHDVPAVAGRICSLPMRW